MDGFKIDLFIAGAQKCGTTSIKEYFREHPNVCSHLQMEMSFFSLANEFSKGVSYLQKKYFSEYRQGDFVVAKNAILTGKLEFIERLYKSNPDCKILFFIRNPIKRAYSSYLMELRNGSVQCSFDEAIELAISATPESEYYWYRKFFLGLSFYADHLDMITTYFKKDQIKVVDIDSFKKDHENCMNDIFKWAGLKTAVVNTNKTHNERGRAKVAWLNHLIKKDTYLKQFLKKIISPSARTKMVNYVFKINTVNEKELVNEFEVSNHTLKLLNQVFEEKNQLLTIKWGVTYDWSKQLLE
ncbi:MAG: sulfotransferase domain-containing protein [Cyclobacteriaceae bacterium]